jgi:hypothetical protein
LFSDYWLFFGLHLSRCKGWVVDAIPFSVVELAFQAGLLVTALAVTAWLPWPKSVLGLATASWRGSLLRSLQRKRIVLLLGPGFLALLGMGQGAFPWSLAPSAWRPALQVILPHPTLTAERQNALLHRHLQSLWLEMTPDRYSSLSEAEALVTCDRLLDSVLARLQLTPGRQVKAIKPMGPLSTLLGLVYGGPAFHDPFFGELAMVKTEDMPSSKFWRLHATCHETAHAKGFTREMDAEILTFLAFSQSDDKRYQALGDLMYLAKSGKSFPIPPCIRADMDAVRRNRILVERRQRFTTFLKVWAEHFHLRNQPLKYGDQQAGDAWNVQHPFFATVMGQLDQAPGTIITYPIPLHPDANP